VFIKYRYSKIILAESKRLAGYLFICIEDKTIFLAQRSKTGNDPNLWEGLGGHLDKGETTEDAAIREVTEEAGSFPGCKIIKTIVNLKNDGTEYTLYLANLTSEQKKNWKPIINIEHQDAKWFSKLPKDNVHPELIKELISLMK